MRLAAPLALNSLTVIATFSSFFHIFYFYWLAARRICFDKIEILLINFFASGKLYNNNNRTKCL